MKKLFFIKLVVGVQLLLISFYLMAGDGGDGRVRVTNLSTETITVSFYACYVIHLCHEVTLPPDYHFTYAYQTWWTTENIIRVKGHIDPTGFRRPVDSTQLSRESDALSECIYFGKKGDPYNSTVNPASQVEGIKCFLPKHREMALQKIAFYRKFLREYLKKEKEKEERRTEEELIRQNEVKVQAKIEEFKVYLMKYGMDFCSRQEFHDLFAEYKINFCHDGLTVD